MADIIKITNRVSINLSKLKVHFVKHMYNINKVYLF